MKVVRAEVQYSLTSEKLNHLNDLAKKMPRTALRVNGKVQLGKPGKVSGVEMLAAGIKFHYDKIVLAEKFYIMRKPIYEDHFHNLIEAFNKNGDAGVTKYLKKKQLEAWKELPFKKKCKAAVSKLKSLLTQTK